MDAHIWQLITARCAPHSTATWMYRTTSMNHTILIFVKMNFNGYYLLLGIRLWIYNAAEGQCDLLAFKWHFAATIHPATTVLEHIVAMKTRKRKYEEFQCQHCLIRFKEYSGTKRYADFTQKLHFFEGFASKKNRKKMLKMKKKILPTCIPCERRVEEEFGTIPEYVPVIQSRLHDDGGDDKATDAHDQDHEGTDHDEGASVADNGDDDAAVMNDRNFIDETAPDNQKYDDQLTKDAHGDCNDEVAKDNQKKDFQGDDKEDDHISRCAEPFIVNVELINNLYV